VGTALEQRHGGTVLEERRRRPMGSAGRDGFAGLFLFFYLIYRGEQHNHLG
jgi:hypothetical protein